MLRSALTESAAEDKFSGLLPLITLKSLVALRLAVVVTVSHLARARSRARMRRPRIHVPTLVALVDNRELVATPFRRKSFPALRATTAAFLHALAILAKRRQFLLCARS